MWEHIGANRGLGLSTDTETAKESHVWKISTRTRTEHERATERRQQASVPPLDIGLVGQADTLFQRVGQHGDDEVLQQDVGEAGDADDEDGECFRGAERVRGL